MSEQNLCDILSRMQKMLAVPKNRYNKFGGYNYRSAEDIIEAVKKLLPEGVALVVTDDLTHMGDRYYVKARAAIICNKGQHLESSAFSREAQEKKGYDQAQITLGASSYARKAALCGLFAIHDGDEAEALENAQDVKHEYKAPTPEETESAFISKEQQFTISDLMFKAKVDSRDFYQKCGISSLAQMPSSMYEKVVNKLNKTIESKQKAPTPIDYASV